MGLGHRHHGSSGAKVRSMAKLEQLLAAMEDSKLRAQLEKEVADLKSRASFGLVYERHLPETVIVGDTDPLEVGDLVRPKQSANADEDFRVIALNGKKARLLSLKTGDERDVPVAELLAIKRFGDPAYAGLTPLGAVSRSQSRPYHAVINGENFHSLQLLSFLYARQVDCIYIDPPYNTGSRDWTYNNDYVDDTDKYRHSKWLSFMEKRLRIAKRLLKPDGVLIVTIDENEVHHLGLLLEQVLPEADRQMVTIVINPKGVTRPGTVRFSRVEEYAYFCFFGDAGVAGRMDDLLTSGISDDDPATAVGSTPRWKGLLRSGTNARRQDRANMFYPVLIDPNRRAAVGTGEPLHGSDPDLNKHIDGHAAAWPVRRDGSWGNWGVGHLTLRTLIDQGFVSVGQFDPSRRTWPLSYLSEELRAQLAGGVLESYPVMSSKMSLKCGTQRKALAVLKLFGIAPAMTLAQVAATSSVLILAQNGSSPFQSRSMPCATVWLQSHERGLTLSFSISSLVQEQRFMQPAFSTPKTAESAAASS